MIEISYNLEGPKMFLEVKGHADYGPLGQDIVCSAISTIGCGLANYIVEHRYPHIARASEGDMYVEVTTYDSLVREVFEYSIWILVNLAENYPLNIKINSKGTLPD